jgi:nitrous oxidase accessory protein NosD
MSITSVSLALFLAVAASLAVVGVATAATIVVPDDYATIQEAVDAANPGDTVYIRAGLYQDNVTINKSLTLEGEHRDTTILCGGGEGDVLHLTASGITIMMLTIRDGNRGIYCLGADGARIIACTVRHHDEDVIKLEDSPNSLIRVCDIIDAYGTEAYHGIGIHMWNSDNSVIEDVRLFDNDGGRTINAQWSDGTTFRRVTLFNNAGMFMLGFGFYTVEQLSIHDNQQGVYLDGCSNSILRDSVIQSVPGCAIHITFHSHNNLFENNIIEGNGIGVQLLNPDVTGNRFCHNNFIANGMQVTDCAPAHPGAEAQYWDDGYPSGGNYWSDYTGSDYFHGPDQNLPGSDGIGDTPHQVLATNPGGFDNYPLMGDPCPLGAASWSQIKAMFR